MTWTTLEKALESATENKVNRKGTVFPYKVSKVSFGFFADNLMGKQYVVSHDSAKLFVWKPYDNSERDMENWWEK